VTLDSIRAVGQFSLIAGILGPLASALPVGLYLAAMSGTPVVAALIHSYLGQSLGTRALTPLLLSLSSGRADNRSHGRLEPALLLLVSLGVAVLVFSRPGSLLFVLLPVLLLSAFRLRAGATALIFVSISVVAIVATALGHGPVAETGLARGTDLLVLQAFIASAMFTMLPINAVITERERLSAALVDTERDLRKAAEAAAAAKSHFLATMSHEIRTPMTGVLGMIELLRSDPLEEERKRFLGTLKQSADLLMTVLDDVLDFSKIESGKLEIEVDDFDFEQLGQDTLDLFFNAASRKGLLLGMTFECDHGPVVRSDRVRIQQVLGNLISTAIKFTDRGTVRVTIHGTDAGPGRQRWRCTVADSGIGISEDKLATLFEPFVQVHDAQTKRFGGTGLGLAISRRLLGALNGDIGVDSRAGQGSSFWFELELPDGDPARVASRPQLPMLVEVPPLQVLVAEDNPVNQMLVQTLLRRMGHSTTCVVNGELAVEAALERKFDCILMDMQMPQMDGVAATRLIRSGGGPNADTPIIALTADASSERRRFYDNAGLTGFLTKPINSDILSRTLGAIATQQRAEDSDTTPDHFQELFNSRALGQLRAAIGPTRLQSLLDLLLEELTSRPKNIRALLEGGDLDGARGEAHSLKGAAHSAAALKVAEAAYVLERACEDPSSSRELLNEALEKLEHAARSTADVIATRPMEPAGPARSAR
jgi:signal transduction histidine kinase/CheY-like chemotaxis protein/HPt (histidine-containing phosphotransfer) domain-containing protein